VRRDLRILAASASTSRAVEGLRSPSFEPLRRVMEQIAAPPEVRAYGAGSPPEREARPPAPGRGVARLRRSRRTGGRVDEVSHRRHDSRRRALCRQRARAHEVSPPALPSDSRDEQAIGRGPCTALPALAGRLAAAGRAGIPESSSRKHAQADPPRPGPGFLVEADPRAALQAVPAATATSAASTSAATTTASSTTASSTTWTSAAATGGLPAGDRRPVPLHLVVLHRPDARSRPRQAGSRGRALGPDRHRLGRHRGLD
jgi:hypothetical protein